MSSLFLVKDIPRFQELTRTTGLRPSRSEESLLKALLMTDSEEKSSSEMGKWAISVDTTENGPKADVSSNLSPVLLILSLGAAAIYVACSLHR